MRRGVGVTSRYQLFWAELKELAKDIAPLSREEKDSRLGQFLNDNGKFIEIGIDPSGIAEVWFHRSMESYLRRNGHEVDIFKEKILEFVKRRSGASREYQQRRKHV